MKTKYRIVTDFNKGYTVEKWTLLWPFWNVMSEPDKTPFSFPRIDAANNFIDDQKARSNFKKEIVKFKSDQELHEKQKQENKEKLKELEKIVWNDLLNYDTTKIQFVYLPAFIWDTTSKKVIDFDIFTPQEESYKIANTSLCRISDEYTIDDFFENNKGKNIVFLVNYEIPSIYFEGDGIKMIRVFVD
jgi:hypothetical protein